ncbi:MAG: 6-pyruvoyl-tetrahydropterin synthase-related protein [Patescibacteria group bacterium]
MNILKRFFPYILIFVLSIFSFSPILTPGFFPIHDDTQVTRVFEMTNALRDGMFPVRWSANLGFGFGYPIFNFYAPFAYYVGAIFNLVISDSLVATKLMMIIGIVIAGISMFILSNKFFGIKGGILSAILYLYAPYHALNIYVRGDVAEFYAYVFIPLVFYGLYMIYKENLFRYVIITSVSFCLVIISHNLTALMIAPFVFIFALILGVKNRKTIVFIILSVILSFMLSAFYFIPTLLEMSYTNVLSQVGGGADFRDHFVCLNQLWTSQWGFGGSAKGCIDGLSYMVGKTHILFSLISVLLPLSFLVYKKVKLDLKDKEIIFFIVLFLAFSAFSIFLMLEASRIFWEALKPMAFFQYPWRFLTILSFTTSFISGGLIWTISKFLKGYYLSIITVVVVALAIIFNLKFFVPQTINNKKALDYTKFEKIAWDISKISSEYMPKGFDKPKQISEISNVNSIEKEGVRVLSFDKKTNNINYKLFLDNQSNVIFPLAYFPAWKTKVNNREVNLIENKKGVMLNLSKGNNDIQFYYKSTQVELISNLITIAGILSLIIGIIYSIKRYGKI